MDGWMDQLVGVSGWMSGWVGGWVEGWMDGWADGRLCLHLHAIESQTDAHKDPKTDRQTDRHKGEPNHLRDAQEGIVRRTTYVRMYACGMYVMWCVWCGVVVWK